MLFRYGILSNLRAKGRTALFALLIFLLTVTLVMGAGARICCDGVIRQADEACRSIAVLEYMGPDYPDEDVPDDYARAAAEALDADALLSVPGVRGWSPRAVSLVSAPGYRRQGGESPYRNNAILTVYSILRETTSEEMAPLTPEELAALDEYVLISVGEGIHGYTVFPGDGEPVFYPWLRADPDRDGFLRWETCEPWTEEISLPGGSTARIEHREREVRVPPDELPDRCILSDDPFSMPRVLGRPEGTPDPVYGELGMCTEDVNTGEVLGRKTVVTGMSAMSGSILYSYDEYDSLMLNLSTAGTDFAPEKGKKYLLHGRFNEVRTGGLPTFTPAPFGDDPDAPYWAEYESLDDPVFQDSLFTRYADRYRAANNYIRLEQAADVEDLRIFQQGELRLEQGSFPAPEEANGCVLSGDLASRLSLSPGDTLTVRRMRGQRENRFDLRETDEYLTLTVRGVAAFSEDSRGCIWAVTDGSAPPLLYGCELGTLSLENARGPEAAAALRTLVPENVRVTLLDQGYENAVAPFDSMRTAATAVLIVAAAGVGAVLVLFAFLFVGRQSETIRILTGLGTPARKIRRWLLGGAAMIAGTAALLGGGAGALILPRVMDAVDRRAGARPTALLYSETSLGMEQALQAAALRPRGAVVPAVCAVIGAALLFCLLFLAYARRTALASRGRLRARVPRGRTSAAGRGGLRFAWLSVRRGGFRSLAVPLISLTLTLFLLLLNAALDRWQRDLDVLETATPIDGQVTSADGRRFGDLHLSGQNLRALRELPRISDFSVSREIAWYWFPEEEPTFSDNEFGQEHRTVWVHSQPSLTGLNRLRAAKEFYYREAAFTWLEGWDEQRFTETAADPLLVTAVCGGGQAPPVWPAVVPDSLLQARDLALGDTFSVKYAVSLPRGEMESFVTLQIVGSFPGAGSRAYLYLPLSAYLDPAWVFDEAPEPGLRIPLNITDRQSAETCLRASASFSTCRFTLASADALEETRRTLIRQDFSRPGHTGRVRCAVLLRDGSYLALHRSLSRNLEVGRLVFGVLFGLVALLGFVVSWLMINGRRSEFALMRGFGAGRGRVFLSFFPEQALLCLSGCIAACAAVPLTGCGVPWTALGLFLACWSAGCALCVALMGRVKLMDLLQERE